MEINKKVVLGLYILTYVCLLVFNFIAIAYPEIKSCFNQLETHIFSLGQKVDGFHAFSIYVFSNPWVVGLFLYGFKIKWSIYFFIAVNILVSVGLLQCYVICA
jgi:hypothetical protein